MRSSGERRRAAPVEVGLTRDGSAYVDFGGAVDLLPYFTQEGVRCRSDIAELCPGLRRRRFAEQPAEELVGDGGVHLCGLGRGGILVVRLDDERRRRLHYIYYWSSCYLL